MNHFNNFKQSVDPNINHHLLIPNGKLTHEQHAANLQLSAQKLYTQSDQHQYSHVMQDTLNYR
jgi:hypothetical protein